MQLPESHFQAFDQLFRAFAPYERERWCFLLGKEPGKWSKITPIKVWPAPSAFDSYPNVPLQEWLALPALAPHSNRETIVLRCGHSKNPGTAVFPLHEVLASGRRSYEVIFEGFVSVVPGKLALGFNHEGGACVFGA